MSLKTKQCADIFSFFGNRLKPKPIVLIAGPCVIESQDLCIEIAQVLKSIKQKLRIHIIFKASFDKANRTSIKSFRGVGIKKGLAILAKVKKETGLPLLTDIHEAFQAKEAAQVVDILQIPAFLCRQTDLLIAAAKTGLPVNIKKAQFMAAWDMAHPLQKVMQSGNKKILLTERGSMFGYNNLVVDICSLPLMREFDVPVIFDATHALQKPSGKGSSSAGEPRFIQTLAQAAVAAGIDGLFLETHPNPSKALSDASTSLALDQLENLLEDAVAIDKLVKKL
jgi:2-dehydro-3-deoxyphosphooctonate aldolase (KDO 8-P synthase)